MIDTKDRILDAAERVFAEFGYAGASLREPKSGRWFRVPGLQA